MTQADSMLINFNYMKLKIRIIKVTLISIKSKNINKV
jgi:hypothetical protein